ncbi:uncharacterized protein TNCV_1928641 [Trichonephila clavipes]|nr:uncharacterized protein TNCV_1928641 [Trichonephila clavipes]
MLPNTLQVYTEYVLVKSVGPKVLWAESRVKGTGEYFPPLQSHGKIVEKAIGGVSIYHPFEEFRRANSNCHLFATTKVIKSQLQDINVNASQRTVRRKLKDLNFKTCRPARKSKLTPAIKAKRLNWAKHWRDKDVYFWRSNKTQFVRRRDGEKFHSDCVVLKL